MDPYRRRDADMLYNELLQQVQQQMNSYRECTNNKLSLIEEMMETLLQEVNIASVVKNEKEQEEFGNPFASDKPEFTARYRWKEQGLMIEKFKQLKQESLLNLNLGIPNFEGPEVCEVFGIGSKEELLSQETYTVEPIYDKEPGGKKDSWPEQEFILKAINGGHINSPNPLPSEVCTGERSEDGDEPLHTQVIQDRKIHNPLQKMATIKFGDGINTGFCLDCPALNGLQRLCEQVCPSKMSKEDPTKGLNHNQGKDVPANYSGLETKSSHLDKKIMIIFDPGGQVQKKKSSSDNNKLKGVSRSEVKPEEAVMKISLGGQHEYCGLQEDVKSTLRLFHLSSSDQAYKQARVCCSTTVRARWPEKHTRCHRSKNNKKRERYEMHQFDQSGTSSHSYDEYSLKKFSLRENARKVKEVIRSKQKQVYKKKTNNKCKKMIDGHSINRWSAERYQLAERNLLEVMKAKGAVFNSPILRLELRLEARKRIGDTGLLDHLLKHVSGKLAPGGAERFRRRHNADGAIEYWLESADLVRVRKEAGVQDPYWTPPPGWTPGDCPSQDLTCAKEFRLLKKENAKSKRDMENMLSKKQLKEKLQNLRREINMQFSKMQRKFLALKVQSSGAISQNLNIDVSLIAPWKSDFDSALVQVKKQTKQLTDISDICINISDSLISLYIQKYQDNLAKVMRFEVKEARRIKYTVTIFDPGGKLGIARSTMRTWLFFKEGELSGTDPWYSCCQVSCKRM